MGLVSWLAEQCPTDGHGFHQRGVLRCPLESAVFDLLKWLSFGIKACHL